MIVYGISWYKERTLKTSESKSMLVIISLEFSIFQMIRNMNFLVLILILCSLIRSLMSSVSLEYEVNRLLRFERNLIDSLDDYFERQKQNNLTFDSNLKSFFQDLHSKHKTLSSKSSSIDFENPISRYQILKRFVKEWSTLKDKLTCTGEDCPLLTGEDVFKIVFKSQKRYLPTENDLEDAALTLLDVLDVYDFDLREITDGKVAGIQNDILLADDIFFIGSVAKVAGKYYYAIKWFEYLLLMIKKDMAILLQMPFNVSHIYRRLASSYYEYGMTGKAIELLEEHRANEPENAAIISDLKHFRSFRWTHDEKSELNRFEDSKIAREDENFRKLCQASLGGKLSVTNLYCSVQLLFGTYGVSRQEMLSLRPTIILIYDVITDNEADILLKYAAKNQQERERYYNPRLKEKARSNTWFCERRKQHPFLDVLSSRVEKITNLQVWPVGDIPSSECYKFLYNEIGSKGTKSQDFWSKEEAETRPDVVNRYVTIRFQLSDKMAGGATVFPKLGIQIPNVKNSVILWWNLKANGKPNPKTVHIDCPIIAGANVMLEKKVFYRNQVNIRTCKRR